jgi:hypothetical protein
MQVCNTQSQFSVCLRIRLNEHCFTYTEKPKLSVYVKLILFQVFTVEAGAKCYLHYPSQSWINLHFLNRDSAT